MAQTIQTPVSARTSPTYSNVPREPNRRPHTTERPLSLNNTQHNANSCSSTCSLFVNAIAHTRTIANVQNRAQCSLRSHRILNKERAFQTMKRCTPARLNQRRTAHRCTPLVRTSQCVPQHFTFVLRRSNTVQLQQSQANSKYSGSSQLDAKLVRATMHSRKRLRYSSRFKMQFPNSFLQPVSCSFSSNARRSHRMVPTTNLQLAS